MSEMDTTIAGAPLGPGTRLNGIFEIDGRIASGGMGEIYRGYAIETGDPVAIKVMRTDLGDNAMALALFRKEASALHNIHHEAIVRYYLFSHDPATQRHYLAMEFVDGQALSHLLKSGPLSLEAVHRLQLRLAGGLEAAHSHDIIHRDLTPDNVLVPAGDVGSAKIIDFGIARIRRAGEGTIIGSGFAGKYNYVSPEQLGLFGGNVTAKSDIYSLGLVLAECLTGTALDMGGSQFGVMAIDRRRTVPDLHEIDPLYRPLLTRMLQPDPADRPNSMAEIAEWQPQIERPSARVQRADATKPPARKMPIPVRGQVTPPRQFPTRTVAFAAIVLGLLAIGGGSLYLVSGIDQPPARAPDGPTLHAGTETAGPPILDSSDEVRRRQINEFINAYDGGSCFHVTPPQIEEKKVTVDGYGLLEGPFDELIKNFEPRFNVELEIGLQLMTPKQCPAVNFLWLMRNQGAPVPRLAIGSGTLSSGSQMTGRVTDFGSRNVYLLLVADNGDVWNLTSTLISDGNEKTFGFKLERDSYPDPQPQQLLMAVIADRPLETIQRLVPERAGQADTLFPRLLAEAPPARQSINVSFKYFYFAVK